MGAVTLLVASLGLLCISQVCGMTKKECRDKYHVTQQTQNDIKKIKQTHSNDVCTLDDVLLTENQAERLADSVAPSSKIARKKRKVMDFEAFDISPSEMWSPDDAVLYDFEGDFTDEQKANIRDGIELFARDTCFDFEETTDGDEAELRFVEDDSSLTYMGRVPANDLPHEVFLSAEGAGRPGEVCHYLGHAFGFWHEHQRPDRDDFVNILTDNISEGEEGNYMVFEGYVNTLGVPYDYGSIMHYPANAFSKNGEPTMDPVCDEELKQWHSKTMGQRSEMTFYDKKQIHQTYCTDECDDDLECNNGGFQNSKNCDECVCPDGFGGTTCESIGIYNAEADCGGQLTVTDDVQNLSSPGYQTGQPYAVGTTCSWGLSIPQANGERKKRQASGDRIKLRFTGDFGVYCRNDVFYHWVEIRTGEDLTGPGVRFGCNERPTLELTSDTNQALVIFKSNYDADDVVAASRVGFQVSYEIGKDACPCENGGICDYDIIDVDDKDFKCICPEGFQGETCNYDSDDDDTTPLVLYTTTTTTPSVCDVLGEEELCKNGGTCENDDSVDDGYRCLCTEDYEGITCGDRKDACPCENGGTCDDDIIDVDDEDFKCNCPEGFEGETCNYGCATCQMPERTYEELEEEPCRGIRTVEVEKCDEYKVSKRKRRGWGWWRKWVTVWETVRRCYNVEEAEPYCGCGFELYQKKNGDMSCAMTGWGAYGECECVAKKCRQPRYWYTVLGGHMFHRWWCGTDYVLTSKQYRNCPDDEGCDEDCSKRWSWWG